MIKIGDTVMGIFDNGRCNRTGTIIKVEGEAVDIKWLNGAVSYVMEEDLYAKVGELKFYLG